MASISNTANYGIARGNISNIKAFTNKDGSKKFMVTVAAKNAYAGNDGSVGCQYIRMEGFIPKNGKLGVYALLEVGDKVEINYIVLNDDYKLDNGKMHYGLVLRIQGVDILESKEAKEYRKAKTAAINAQAGSLESSIDGETVGADGSAFMDASIPDDELIFN